MTLIERMDMKLFLATTLSLCMIALAPAQANQSGAAPGANAAPSQAAQAVSIARSGSQPSANGPAEYFTGTVRIDSPFQASIPARVGGGTVTFEPGARAAWHMHPLGQTLIVTAGAGLVQQWGSPVQEIRPGDVVWIPPGVKHWHGASPTTGMTHIAINEALDGKAVDWMEKVTDEQYRTD
jgi:quercetin dioxygenase-like cupin family protein